MKHLIWLISGLLLSASPLIAAPAASDADIPDALKHMVKAPEIDFANLRDPFASYLARVATSRRAALLEKQKIMANRKRDPLEAFDLDVLRLVAVFSMGGERVAMIEDAANKGYIVRQGNYVGKNNGKIDKIDDNTVYFTEQVFNPAGDIVNHQVTLTMKELNE
ncbi:MAG: pilus assembly protein PilP [Mariprofundus sp.]|nr:pilus assembly protein PilP [Mariprofundus sp.]